MSQPINIKMVIVGDGAIGKTCVMMRYTEHNFTTDYTPTIFDNKVKSIRLENMDINLNLWDTAGQEGFNRLRSVAYPNTDIFFIAFSVVQQESFVNAKKRWYAEVKTEVPSARALFVGTKADLRLSQIGHQKAKPLSKQQIQKNLESELGCKYLQCSALTGEGIDELFNEGVRVVLRNQGYLKENMKKSNSSKSQKSGKLVSGKRVEKENEAEGYCSTCQLI